MRHSTSTLIAIIISFFTFLGMSLLVTSPQTSKQHSFDTINFSMIEEMKAPDVKSPSKPKEPPPQEKVSQPPAAPKLNIDVSTERPVIELPDGNTITKDFNLTLINLHKPTTPGRGLSNNNDLTQVFSIQPIYPIKQLKNKVSGWVKVEFTVNELGRVKNINILDAQPKHVFNDAVKRALMKSKFQPAMVDGHAVSQTAVQLVEFKIE